MPDLAVLDLILSLLVQTKTSLLLLDDKVNICLMLAVVFTSYAWPVRTSRWIVHPVNLSSSPVIWSDAVITLSNPSLVDIQPRRFIDLDSLSVFGLDLDWVETRLPLVLGSTKTHTTTDNSLVSGMLQMLLHISRSLLLRESHLHNSLLNCLASNLVGDWEKFLERGGEVVRLGLELSLSLLQDLGLGETPAVLHVADDHLALPAHTRHRGWVQSGGHGVRVSGLGDDALRLWLWSGDGLIFEDGGGCEVTADESWALLWLFHLLKDRVGRGRSFYLLDILSFWSEPVEECARLGGWED